MSQHGFTIPDDIAEDVRLDIQAALQALASNSLGSSAPTTTYAGMIWVSSTGGIYIRDASNSAWIGLPIQATTGTLNDSLGSGGATPIRVKNAGGFLFPDSTQQQTAYPNFSHAHTYHDNPKFISPYNTWTEYTELRTTASLANSAFSWLVLVDIKFSMDRGAQGPLFQILRDSTVVNAGASSVSPDVPLSLPNWTTYSLMSDEQLMQYTAFFFDTPGDTSNHTYKIMVKTLDSAQPGIIFNETFVYGQNAPQGRSSLSLINLAGTITTTDGGS